jgi:putative ABC transport system permease protein
MADDEILVNDWLASNWALKVGDRVEMTYFDPEAGARLIEKTNAFRVRAVVPLAGLHADRTLMPEFPGLAKAESTKDWDAGFPLAHKIRDQDEAYWKTHRGTPKAFVSWKAGRRALGQPVRGGDGGSVRGAAGETPAGFRQLLAANLRATLRPGDVGLSFQPVRERALTAARSGQDFRGPVHRVQLLPGSCGAVAHGVDVPVWTGATIAEVGTLLAMGFTPRTVKRLWLAEGLLLASLGSLVGVVGGALQARLMIHGLTHQWRDAVGGAALTWAYLRVVLVTGFFLSVVACVGALELTLRRQFLRPVRELLAGEVALPPRRGAVGAACWVSSPAWPVLDWSDGAGERGRRGAGDVLWRGQPSARGRLALVSAWLGSKATGGSSAGPAGVRLTGVGLAYGVRRVGGRAVWRRWRCCVRDVLIAALGAFRLDANRGAGCVPRAPGGLR